MTILNIEFKARCTDLKPIRELLQKLKARYAGEDHQVDTYFTVPSGRLKLREGNIEKALIFYQRKDQAGPKQSDVLLYPTSDTSSSLKALLSTALGIHTIVDKVRQIYFIDNVKIHLDRVNGLGAFVEVEAIDEKGDIGVARLQTQCQEMFELFGLSESSLVAESYSDLLVE